jgi:hypothetical protein
MNSLDIPSEFLEEQKKLDQTMPDESKKSKRKGGRYTKQEIIKRQDEVFKLHFDYGYSARKIAKQMEVNRNTINNDLNFWYTKIGKKHNIFNPEDAIILNLEMLEIQRCRLRELLDNTKSFKDQLCIERLIYDIDCKVLHTNQKLTDSAIRMWNFSVDRLNDLMKKEGKGKHFMMLFDKLSVSEKTGKQIDKIIMEDKKQINHL